jgi:hypothetical protein
MIVRWLAVTCVTVLLLVGGSCKSTCTETKTPQVTEAPKAPEAPKATEAPKAAETPKAVEAPKAPAAPKPAEAPKPAQAPAAAAAPAPAARTAVRVNCGDTESYTDKSGNTWAADQEWAAGKTWGADDGMTVDRGDISITGTDASRVYQTERYSMAAYKFTLPNGKYTVRLHFCETYEGITAAGERVFSVSLQGKEVLKDLDVLKEAGGSVKPLIKEFKGVAVDNGQLVIGFTPNVENPQINGIEIAPE